MFCNSVRGIIFSIKKLCKNLKPYVSLDLFYKIENRVSLGGREEEGQSLLELTRVPDKILKRTKHSNPCASSPVSSTHH